MSHCCVVTSNYGPMIINYVDTSVGRSIGHTGTHEQDIINLGLNLINKIRDTKGNGVNVLDIGANVGMNTIAWAKALLVNNVITGTVTAFEPQERLYYMLAGNIALNNLLNARAYMEVVSNKTGVMKIPVMDHSREGAFGGLSMLENKNFNNGQIVSFDEKDMKDTRTFMLDSMKGRVDLVKIDVEGMEPHVLDGAQKFIARERPIFIAEYIICSPIEIKQRLKNYRFLLVGACICAIPEEQDEMFNFIKSTITYNTI